MSKTSTSSLIRPAFIVIQIAVTLILLISLFVYHRNSTAISPEPDAYKSEFLTFDNGVWSSELVETEPGVEKTIIKGSFGKVKAGSYSFRVDYVAGADLFARVYSEQQDRMVRCEPFLLVKNKNSITYDFYVTYPVDNLEFYIRNMSGPNPVSVSGISICRTGANLRMMLLIWIVLCICADLILFSETVRKHRNTIAAVLAIALFASLPLFIHGIVAGHDLSFHLDRIEGIAEGLKSGQFPVRIYSVYNDDYGYPLGVFYGDALLYIPALLRLTGFPISAAFKIFVFIINLLTAITAYACCHRISRDGLKSAFIALVYVVSNYRLVDIYARSAIGEFAALIFFPLLAMAVYGIYTQDTSDRDYFKNSLLLSGGMLGLLYTHILSVELAAVTLIIIALICFKKTFRRQTLLLYLHAIVTFVLCGLAFIIPFLDYYIHTDVIIKTYSTDAHYIQHHGAYLNDYFSFFKQVAGGSVEYAGMRMQFTPGLIMMTALIAAVILIFLRQSTKPVTILASGSIILLIMASDIFPWNFLDSASGFFNLFANIQFPWRLLGICCVTLSLLTYYVIERITELKMADGRIYPLLIFAVFVTTCVLYGNIQDNCVQVRFMDTAELPRYTYDPLKSDYSIGSEEYLPKGSDVENLDYDVSGENASGYVLNENGIRLSVHADAVQGGYLDVPRFNYPFYRAVTENGANACHIENGINNRIRLCFDEDYSGMITVDFHSPFRWRISELISLIAVLAIAAYELLPAFRRRADAVS